jgi:hypothetical protein
MRQIQIGLKKNIKRNMKVGTLVECINGSFSLNQIRVLKQRPNKGSHYFIRAILEYPHGVGVLLEELTNPPVWVDGQLHEPSFAIERFREIEGLDEAIDELMEVLEVQEV